MLDELMGAGGLLGGEVFGVLVDVIFIKGFVDVLDGLPSVGLVTPDGDSAVAAGYLDEVVAMVRHRHELG